MSKSVGGRPVVFGGKVRDSEHRFQGWFSTWAKQQFEAARTRLSALTKNGAKPSDSDVVEFLLRGVKGTKDYLRE